MTTAAHGLSIGRIDYLNVAPVYYRFDIDTLPEGKSWKVLRHPPGTLNRLMAEGKLDISAVSAAAYAMHAEEWRLIPRLSIGCSGPVMSVLLLSHKPMGELHGEPVRLSEESASAALLVKLLIQEAGAAPAYCRGTVRDISDTGGMTAALVIGDAALTRPWAEHFPYVYDLGVVWMNQTGLPFVFGVWAVRDAVCRTQPEDVRAVCDLFYRSLQSGMTHIQDIIDVSVKNCGLSREVLTRYFQVLHYHLPDSHIQGLRLFYDRLYGNGLIEKPVALRFFEG